MTDLTRFHNQGLVCVAGVNPETGQCIRPFLANGNGGSEYLNYDFVRKNNIVPGSNLSARFIKKQGTHAPHTEDHIVSGELTTSRATRREFQEVLDSFSFTTVAEGFGENPTNKYFAIDNAPPISIFTLKITNPQRNFNLMLTEKYGAAFKVNFTDEAGFRMEYLKVTDLGFSDRLEEIQKERFGAFNLNRLLTSQDVVYLRVGLGQPFAPNDDESRRGYYVQINGIYSFPDFREDLRTYD